MESFGIICHLLLFASAFSYDLGITNNYNYETSVVVTENCGDSVEGNHTGHSLKAKVLLTSVWQDPQNVQRKLLKIRVLKPKLLVSKKSAFEERKSNLEKIIPSDSFFLLNNGRVEKFWGNPSEQSIVKNLKRSVASLLQVQRKDGHEKMDDVSGKCDIHYKTEGKTIRRSKTDCQHPIEESGLSQPFGVRSQSVRRSVGIDCNLKDDVSGIVSMCLVTEQLKTNSNLWERASICVLATSVFTLEGTSESKDVFKNVDLDKVMQEVKKKGELNEGNLIAVQNYKEEQTKVNLADSIKSFQESLKATHLSKLKSASAFFKLLPLFRSATKEDLLQVLQNKKFGSVLPQILDLVAASSTPRAVEAAVTFFGKMKDYDEKLERYLISLSVIPRPDFFVLKEIKTFLEKGNHHEKIEATLINTLGALLRNYAKNDKADSEVVKDVLGYLEGALKKCTSEACILTYLRGLRNAAQPQSVPQLLEYALKGGKPSLEALLAIGNVPSTSLSLENQQSLLKVYHQVGKKQDRSSRVAAAEILLKGNPNEEVLRSILKKLSDQTDEEFSTLVASKTFDLVENNKELRSRIFKILPEKEISYYYSLSQKGKSSLFKRPLMSTDGLNVTYGIEMELVEGGLLKRSNFDVALETDSGASNLLSVGMFAEGLGSLAGGSSSEEDENPLAGMELTILGSSLRPYIFFSSTGELMGHYWSGTASELTPALQAIFSLSDDTQFAVLHNGMLARLELRGVLSTDLSAAIQMSMWSKTSQSQVKNAAALLVKGSAVIDTEFVKSRGEYLYYGNSAIDFSTDIDFGDSPFKMCFQMEHPNAVVKHDFQRSVEVTEAKFSVKKTKKRKRFIPSRSYALHQNNNELCRIMKGTHH